MATALALAALLALAAPASTETRPAPARIAYDANGSVHTIGADGSDRRLVIRDAEDPDWSPDGGSLAFVRRGRDDDPRIWVAARDGSGAREVTTPPRGRIDSDPAWSPDGRSIAFVRSHIRGELTLVTAVMSAPVAGGAARTVARIESKRDVGFGSLDWSPDGARILATVSTRSDDAEEIAPSLQVVDVASGRRTRLVRDATDGAWSPAGDRIAYIRTPRCEEDSPCNDLYVANADGGGAKRLTSVRDRGATYSPSWSADGERIAFVSDRNYPSAGSLELYSIRPDGACLTWLTNGTTWNFGPEFEPVAGPPTDPGGCGAVPREPLIEVDTSELERYRAAPIWWLGPRVGNLLLSDAEQESGNADLSYDDCASYDPAECPDPVYLSQLSTCDFSIHHYEDGSDLARRGAVLVYAPDFEDLQSPVLALVGPTAVVIDGLRVDDVLAGLRRFGDDAPPPGGLPNAQLPSSVWRTLERVRAAVRKYGTAGAARRLKRSRGAIRRVTALDRRLRELGPVGRTTCRD